ncbi:NAD+ synthase [Methanococcus voltae]|uniref:NH(3)-dependent NAD(+) synthetase n=1 Tax=Methanococcus voltae (strain ATCC BAA-1334 / A3) TaxID=456320 RepID=D7DRE6_METV3|nr:NAD+ synthase [Methanococcus voltae]MCS3901083.1 NAD+ synthase [Methanococcus voltae]
MKCTKSDLKSKNETNPDIKSKTNDYTGNINKNIELNVLDKKVNLIVDFIREYYETTGVKGVVLGLSGGIDSSLVAHLAVKALGADKVYGIIMPESKSNPMDKEHGELVAHLLGINYHISDITPLMEAFGAGGYSKDENGNLKEFDKLADGNLKSRFRMCTLYYHANKNNNLVLGTGNKSEIYMGYGTKFGDLGCDVLPIGHLFKTEVRELARYIGVPEDIITKAPSGGLWEGQTDEKEMGITYETLDKLLGAMEMGKDPEYTAELLNISTEQMINVMTRIDNNKHKSLPLPIPNKYLELID